MKTILLALALIFSVSYTGFSQNEEVTSKADSVKQQANDMLISPGPENKEAKYSSLECIKGDCENGVGTKNYQTGTYTGSWKNGLRHGHGKYVWNNGDMYDGQWSEDDRNGFGTYTWHDGSKYVGNYSKGERCGYGIYYYTNGNIYEGTWQDNMKHGIANFYFENSVNIGGKYVDNKYIDGTGITQDNYPYKPKQ